MKPSSFFNFNGAKDLSELKNVLSNTITNFYNIFNKNIGFNDNIDCFVATDVYFAPTATTTIKHQLGKVPIGYIIIKLNNFNATFSTGTWTDTTISIYSDYEMTATVLVLGS